MKSDVSIVSGHPYLFSVLTDATVRAVELILVIKIFIVRLVSLPYMYAGLKLLKSLDSQIPLSVLYSS